MSLPSWVEANARTKMTPEEQIVEVQVLAESPLRKLAVVHTNERDIVVSRGLFGGRAFDLVRKFRDGAPASQPTAAEQPGSGGSQAAALKADDLTTLPGIGAVRAEKLKRLGIVTFDGLVSADTGELAAGLGVSQETVRSWQAAVRKD